MEAVRIDISGAQKFMQRAEARLSRDDAALLRRLHRFTGQRLASARSAASGLEAPDSIKGSQRLLHRFLRDCYDVLNGCAREVNLCMHHSFPDAGLYPPHRMTRQCGLYTVRKILRESPETSSHPVSLHLWNRTRDPGDDTYRQLSFLYNLATFVPVPLLDEGTTLPGDADLPDELQPFSRDREIDACRVGDGTAEMLEWTEDFVGKTYELLAGALTEDADATDSTSGKSGGTPPG
ncbi:MAG: hypothetical protein V5A84_02510 [Planctomycetota bacterium]